MTATLDSIAEKIRTGMLEEAGKALKGTSETEENRVDLAFLRGYVQERTDDPTGAVEAYNRALDLDPEHHNALFRLATLCERAGDDEAAIEFYERCTASERTPVSALINLAVLYEDAGRASEAERCVRHVLAEHPTHTRAKEILGSVRRVHTMVYDERQQREQEQRGAVLDIPVTDFELSVRSRNCLRQMNIFTLGDLLRTTEVELLAYKNFGETSLNEIKAMLSAKRLELGQNRQPAPEAASAPEPEPVGEVAGGDIPVSSLELSVRSRKCLQRLGVATLAELAHHSEAELTAAKNFGQTSLNEIKRQLARFGLSFRTLG